MDKKKVLNAIWVAIVFGCILIGAGAAYQTHIVATGLISIVAFIYATKEIKKMGQ